MKRTRRRMRGRRGTALVEFVILLPFYCTALFGALEFGQIFQDRLQLTNAAREGVRRAAVGKTTSGITAAIRNTAPRLGIDPSQITIEYNDKADGTGTWRAVTNDAAGVSNAVNKGLLVRVTITDWPHRLLTGSYFNFLPSVSNGSLLMHAQEVMVRE